MGKSGDLLRYYTLVLSNDGTTLYAANAALGVVSTINLSEVIFNGNIHDTVKFDTGNVSLTNDDKTRMLHNGAILSSDQKTLYVVGVRGVWALDALTLAVRGHYPTSQVFTGIALSTDSKTLLLSILLYYQRSEIADWKD